MHLSFLTGGAVQSRYTIHSTGEKIYRTKDVARESGAELRFETLAQLKSSSVYRRNTIMKGKINRVKSVKRLSRKAFGNKNTVSKVHKPKNKYVRKMKHKEEME